MWVGRLGRRRKKERKRAGHDGKGKDRLPLFPFFHRSPRTFYFPIIAIFIGIPRGSLCGGESLDDLWKTRRRPKVACVQTSPISFVRARRQPEGVYAGCVGVRKNYRYVGWKWKVE